MMLIREKPHGTARDALAIVFECMGADRYAVGALVGTRSAARVATAGVAGNADSQRVGRVP